MIYNGIPIIVNQLLAKYEYPVKTWVDLVLEWNPCNIKKLPIEIVNDVVWDKINNRYYMSPLTFSEFKKALMDKER